MIKGGPTPPLSQLYAFDAAQSREAALANFDKIYDFVERKVRKVGDSAVQEPVVESADEDPASPSPEPPNRPSSASAPWRASKRYRRDSEEACNPEWATFNQGIVSWHKVLSEKFGCDEDCIQDLYLLAQHSTEGYEAANTIVHKLFKKRQDGEALKNPSGFVHKCVVHARHAWQA